MPATKTHPARTIHEDGNVTTLMVGLKKRSHTQKSHPKVVNPRDIAGERKKKKKKKTSMDESQMTKLISRVRQNLGLPAARSGHVAATAEPSAGPGDR